MTKYNFKMENIQIGIDGNLKISDYGFIRQNPEISQQLSDRGTQI